MKSRRASRSSSRTAALTATTDHRCTGTCANNPSATAPTAKQPSAPLAPLQAAGEHEHRTGGEDRGREDGAVDDAGQRPGGTVRRRLGRVEDVQHGEHRRQPDHPRHEPRHSGAPGGPFAGAEVAGGPDPAVVTTPPSLGRGRQPRGWAGRMPVWSGGRVGSPGRGRGSSCARTTASPSSPCCGARPGPVPGRGAGARRRRRLRHGHRADRDRAGAGHPRARPARRPTTCTSSSAGWGSATRRRPCWPTRG